MMCLQVNKTTVCSLTEFASQVWVTTGQSHHGSWWLRWRSRWWGWWRTEVCVWMYDSVRDTVWHIWNPPPTPCVNENAWLYLEWADVTSGLSREPITVRVGSCDSLTCSSDGLGPGNHHRRWVHGFSLGSELYTVCIWCNICMALDLCGF